MTKRRALRRRRRMIKDLVRRVALTLAIVSGVAITGYLFLHNGTQFDDEDWAVEYHVVEHGDTLWGIGRTVVDDTVDIREWIYEVEKLNSMDGANLKANEAIKIYVPKIQN